MLKKDGEEIRLENIENEEKIAKKEVQWERENRKEKERECVYEKEERRRGRGKSKNI